jgi:hypothetical protein
MGAFASREHDKLGRRQKGSGPDNALGEVAQVPCHQRDACRPSALQEWEIIWVWQIHCGGLGRSFDPEGLAADPCQDQCDFSGRKVERWTQQHFEVLGRNPIIEDRLDSA